MTRAAFAALLGAATLALGGCGSDDGARADDQRPPTGDAKARATADKPRAAAAAKGVRLASVGRFDAPLHVAAPPADRRRVFVVEQDGAIRVVRGGRKLSRPFLDLRSKVVAGGEQGLLSLAFAPDYHSSRRFYVNYTDQQGLQRVVEYRRAKSSGDRALRGSARLVLKYDDLEPNHNGGQLAFGPDRLLYIGTGDGGGGNDDHGERGNAQNLANLLGKILRIDPRSSSGRRYSVPGDNPFVGRDGADEIYSYGLRNPWRFSFDRTTGDLTIGDVGQNAREEINFASRDKAVGVNYGWRPFEGTRRNFDENAPGHVPPVLELSHGDGNCSVTGGYVVRDRTLPALAGRYVYGDFCKGQLRSAKLSPGTARDDRSLGLSNVKGLSSFGEDARGRVYVVSLEGAVYRLTSG